VLESTQWALDMQSTEKALQSMQTAQAVQPTAPPPTFTPQPTEPPPTEAPAATVDVSARLVVENNSSTTICYLYLSLSSDSEWGSDQLGDTSILPGESYELWDIPPGTYDMRITDCSDNQLAVQQAVDFYERDEVTWALEDDEVSQEEATDVPIPVNYCVDSSGGRTKVRVENHTEAVATLYLYGVENYICTIDPGVQRIYIKGGNYTASAVMCGGQTVSYGTNVINSTWYLTLYCP
jgi:hypothetical protein